MALKLLGSLESSGGNFGIGTANPTRKLHVVGGSIPAALLDSDQDYTLGLARSGIEEWWLKTYTDGRFAIHENGVGDSVTIKAGGNVGIGTTNPSAQLQIDTPSTNNAGQGLRLNRPSAGTNYHSVEFATNGTVDWSIGQNTNDAFEVYENGVATSTRLTIKEGGNVGIGSTAPAAKLNVASTGANAYSSTITKGTNMKGIINALSNNADDMVGIYFGTGTTSEGTHWSGITGSRSQSLTDWSTQLNFYTHDENISNITKATQKMVIKGSGNVGIGTTAPQSKLDVSLADGTYVRATNSTNNISSENYWGFGLYEGTALSAAFRIVRDGTGNQVSIGTHNNQSFAFWQNATERMRIHTDGNVGIGITEPTQRLHVNGNATITGWINAGNYIATPLFYNTGNHNTLNKTGTGWISWATRDTTGSETVINLSSIGTFSSSGAVTLSNIGNHFNGHHYFDAYDANGNHYPHYQSGSNANGAVVNTRVYTDATNYKVFKIDAKNNAVSWDGNNLATESYVSDVQDNLDSLAGSLGTLAYSSATIPTNNNQLTNGAGYITSVPSEYLTQTEGNARYLSLTGGTLTGNINANGSILGDGNLFLRSYNNDPKGIFFRDGFEYGDTNQYNLSITIHDDGDGAADGMMISAYDGVFFNVQSGSTPSTKFRVLNNEVKAFVNLVSTGIVYASGGNSGNWNTAYSWGDHASAGYGAASDITAIDERIDIDVLPLIQTPAITSNGSTPSLNSGISAAEIRSLIGAGTSSSDTNYYLSGASFNTGDGVLTLTVSGAANQTVDLDGRYQIAGSYLTTTGKAADSNLFDGIDSVNFVYGNAKGTNDSVTTDADGLDKTGYYTSSDFVNRPEGVANWMYIEHIKLYNNNTQYQKQIGYDTYDNRMWVRTKEANNWTNWAQIWTSGEFSPSSYLTTTGKAADSELLDGLDSGAFLRSNASDTATGVISFNAGINTLSINDTSGQQLVICAGEAGIDASQNGELVYVNAENGFQVAASNDNWATGYAGTKKTIIDYNGITYDGNVVWHTGNFNPSSYQPAGTYNTIIGTDSDINTSGSTIIDNIYVTDGVITSMGTRTLTAADLGIAQPGPAEALLLTIVNDTINVTFNQSPSSVDNYLIFSSVDGGDYGLISVLSPQDMGATMSVIDSTFRSSGVIAYRIYAVNNGIYSDPLEGDVNFTTPVEEVANLSSVSLNTAYYVQWDSPVNSVRFVDRYVVYSDAKDTQAALTRDDATLLYDGQNTNYMYAVSSSNFSKYHQFWVEVIYR